MTKESLVAVCPNPKCRKEIEEPIVLTILSVTPPKQYEACPYCFAKLEKEEYIEKPKSPEPKTEQKEDIEPEEIEETADSSASNIFSEKAKDTGPKFFQKVKALIPSGGHKKEKQETEIEVVPEVKKEKAPKEKTKTEQKPEPTSKKEESKSGCPESFGYLANRPKDVPIPQGCLTCPKMVDCMLSPRQE